MENLVSSSRRKATVYFNYGPIDGGKSESLEVILSPTGWKYDDTPLYSFPYRNGLQYAGQLETENGPIWMVVR